MSHTVIPPRIDPAELRFLLSVALEGLENAATSENPKEVQAIAQGFLAEVKGWLEAIAFNGPFDELERAKEDYKGAERMYAELLKTFKQHEQFRIHKRAELLLSFESESEDVRQAKVSLELSGEVKKLADLEASVDDWQLLTELARSDWEYALAKRSVQAKTQTGIRTAQLTA